MVSVHLKRKRRANLKKKKTQKLAVKVKKTRQMDRQKKLKQVTLKMEIQTLPRVSSTAFQIRTNKTVRIERICKTMVATDAPKPWRIVKRI